MELDSLETIYNMIVHDLGVAIIPKPCFDNYLSRQIRFIPIGKVPRTRNIGVLSRKDSQVFPLIDAFQSALGAVFDKDKFG
jgi:DNA-binding transcriptional LysR family regulator